MNIFFKFMLAGVVLLAAATGTEVVDVVEVMGDVTERAQDIAREAGAKRVVPLQVSAPFHCALMQPAQRRLATDLDAIDFRDARIPLVNNFEASVVTQAADVRTRGSGDESSASARGCTAASPMKDKVKPQ